MNNRTGLSWKSFRLISKAALFFVQLFRQRDNFIMSYDHAKGMYDQVGEWHERERVLNERFARQYEHADDIYDQARR
ncbi:hypothetical protein [Sporosarcina cascadiensis]|uniref:hypothetical protein n=1 Tax=Sporosarcina cascadiensis TaxID=2660747 RepID=UPI00129ABC10|nr:hypothetical protein [Sporosarcina cascadiensis]